MSQRWSDLLFAHWPVPVNAVRPLVPAALPIDLYQGAAWVSIAPFRVTDLRPRGLPAFPSVSAFPELNVRTYVTLEGKPGVWFFSLDAGSWLAVLGARTFYQLPYFKASMSVRSSGDGSIAYSSRRAHPGAPEAELNARYGSSGERYRSTAGSLEHWLTERYCLYAADSRRRLYRTDIHHVQWPLEPAFAELRHETMTRAAGVEVSGAPALMSFTRQIDVAVWWPERVGA